MAVDEHWNGAATLIQVWARVGATSVRRMGISADAWGAAPNFFAQALRQLESGLGAALGLIGSCIDARVELQVQHVMIAVCWTCMCSGRTLADGLLQVARQHWSCVCVLDQRCEPVPCTT
jgi:hypothetical protein